MKTVENFSIAKEVLQGTRNYSILEGNCLATLRQLPSDCVQTVVTSPPYFGLRNYGTEPQFWYSERPCDYHFHEWVNVPPRRFRTEHDTNSKLQKNNKGANCALPPTKMCCKCGTWIGELGLEPTPEMFVQHLADVFDEVRRVLRPDGVCFINIADSYWKEEKDNKHRILKSKDLCLVPQRLAIALQERGWYIRAEIIWDKTNCMPESVQDRPSRSHEQIWMVTKNKKYFWDSYAIREYNTEPELEEQEQTLLDLEPEDDEEDGTPMLGANKRTVWRMATTQFKGDHYASFPYDLPKTTILAATSGGGCCSGCGTPVRHVLQKKSLERYELPKSDPRYRPSRYEGKYEKLKGKDGNGMRYTLIEDAGYNPSCKCNAPIIPCVVLDPFNGAGSTGLVAMQLGRNYIGCELLPEYITMTHERYTGGLPLFQFME